MPETNANKAYIAIDLKSFYASAECAARGLDPMTTHLVVADESRTPKTICLAVSPSLKALGIGGRARLYQVIERVDEINEERRLKAPARVLGGGSADAGELAQFPEKAVEFVAARPRMSMYMQVSTDIYRIYLRYFAPESMHVYSVDEVFIDYTDYAALYGLSARAFASRVIREIQAETSIPAVAGIGTNLYLAKVALDIQAKHAAPDEYGVRIAELDELTYRKTLWDHQPLTDFWRVGRGIAKKLTSHGMETMGDVALCSSQNEEVLYSMFGKNAELLIDHAWGWEPCTMEDIHAYVPKGSSLGSGQVLREPYTKDKARIVLCEMADELALELVSRGMCTDQLVIGVGYDVQNLREQERAALCRDSISEDFYGRKVPKSTHGSSNLGRPTASGRRLMEAAAVLFDKVAADGLLIRRINITANHVVPEQEANRESDARQMDMFSDFVELAQEKKKRQDEERERKLQNTILALRKQYGNTAVMRGLSLEEGATGMERGRQIGGHRA